LKQLQDNAKLLGEKSDLSDRRVKRVEYIFSTEKTANDNKGIIKQTFAFFLENIAVYYIDNITGQKVRLQL
jgi:hypothetical protein